MVKADRKGNVYTTNSYGEIVDCPCESKSQANMIDTDADTYDKIDSMSVLNHGETSYIWEETVPADIT